MTTLSPNDVVAELAQLTSSQIAERLELLGFKGQVESECNCPVALYLESMFDGALVYHDHITVFSADDPNMERDVDIPIENTTIENFVFLFDNHHFEGLIADDTSGGA